MPRLARQSTGYDFGENEFGFGLADGGSVSVKFNGAVKAASGTSKLNGTNFPQLFANDASITTHALNVGIPNGLVPGNLVLIMPDQDIVLANRSPAQRDAS